MGDLLVRGRLIGIDSGDYMVWENGRVKMRVLSCSYVTRRRGGLVVKEFAKAWAYAVVRESFSEEDRTIAGCCRLYVGSFVRLSFSFRHEM